VYNVPHILLYLLYLQLNTPVIVVLSAFSQCEEGWRAYEDKCYYFSTNTKSWDDARADCVGRGSHLASFHTQEELSFITGEWLTKYGGYHWSDATPVSHTNWGHGEPNNHEGREDCVEMVSNTNGTSSWWNDLNCDAHQDWICMISKGKKPIVPPVPPPPVPGSLA
uniref:C-type lectin domain-containing protein n=1 Tax=Oncorhynchus mykiss TaxID=8022 RepID=A0A8C7Q4F0_ONCMY